MSVELANMIVHMLSAPTALISSFIEDIIFMCRLLVVDVSVDCLCIRIGVVFMVLIQTAKRVNTHRNL